MSEKKQNNLEKRKVKVKVGMVGDSMVGTTSLMVKYVDGNFNEDYIQTLGVNFMEKTIPLRKTDIELTIWEIGGDPLYRHMIPLICNDALALLFVFDLSRRSTLASVKSWYKQARELNKRAIPFLIGTKYDYFVNESPSEQDKTIIPARKIAKAMNAPLIFCSAAHSINVQEIIKIVLSKVFNLKCGVKQNSQIGDPIIEY